jgi:hypothetical protein
MLRSQNWIPDTHPHISLDCEYDDTDSEGSMTCVKATVNGIVSDNPGEVYAQVRLENSLKNLAEAKIMDLIPDSMRKQAVDGDGDPLFLDSTGRSWSAFGLMWMNDTGEVSADPGELTPSMVIKDKHKISWFYGEADGKLSFNIPGAAQELLDTITAALTAAFGDSVTLA